MDSPLCLKFWGTRGLISSPRTDTAIFGGNTTCMQVLFEDRIIVIDTGFGVTNLGESLLKKVIKGENLCIDILYTHFHWDHIQGLPFFHPIYFPNTTLNLYSPISENKMEEHLNFLFDGSYSPFEGIRSMPSKINFIKLKDGQSLGKLKVEFIPLDHGDCAGGEQSCSPDKKNNAHDPIGFGYRLTDPEGKRLVIATDHEARSGVVNSNLICFAKHAELLVHDAQYLHEEYIDRVGWGHSSIEQALENARKSQVRKILLTHHDPARTDKDIQEIHKKLRSSKKYIGIDFEFACEEINYDISAVEAKKNLDVS